MLYAVLAHVSPSPVVELNRAVAVGNVYGPQRALPIVDGLDLPGYALLPAVRGDLLARLGPAEALKSAVRPGDETRRTRSA